MRVRGWRADVLWAAMATAAAVGTVRLGLEPDPPAERAALLIAFLSGAAMVAARRWPGPVLAVQMLLVLSSKLYSPFTVLVPTWLLLITLAILAYRSGWVPTVAGVAAAFASMLVLDANGGPGTSPRDVFQLIAEAGLAAAPVAIGRYLRGVRQATQVARERAAEAEAVRDIETRAARLAERSRLARDLHDIVAHHIGAMTLRASSGKLALDTSGDTAVAGAALTDVAATGRRVLDELRRLLTVLRDPDAIDAEAMFTDPNAAIKDAVMRTRNAGVPVEVDLDRRLAGASLLARTTAARAAQEALTNVLKHAGPGTPTRLTVTVEPPGTVRLQVTNDRPVDAAHAADLPASGHGLAGMRDRVALLGGKLVAGPIADQGWSVTVTLPAGER